MNTSPLFFPVTGEDIRALRDAPFRAGDTLSYVRTRRVDENHYVIARVAGVIGVHRGVPPGAKVVGRVTGSWRRM